MLFLGIISWKGTSRFNGGIVFQMEGASFLSGAGAPWGASVLMGGSKKIDGWGDAPPSHAPHALPQLWETLKLFIKKGLLEEMEWVNDNASAFGI